MTTTVSHTSWAVRAGAFSSRVLLATTLCAGLASQGAAQLQNTVTLKVDGGEGVTGELIEFSDGVFRIKARVGLIAVPVDGVECIGAACPEGTRLETTKDRLVLTARDGSITMTGDLLEITDGQYVLATDFGEMKIDVSVVDCEGSGCVVAEDAPVYGGKVVLTSAQGKLEGILVDNFNDAYVVDVASLGIVRVSKETYDCGGPGCP